MSQQLALRRPALATLPEFIYLTEMADEDFGLGFSYREIASPTPSSPERRVTAAVFSIDDSNRIVRIYDPVFNRPGYVHQCYGVGKRLLRQAWRAVQLTYPDARMALNAWRNGRDNLEFGNSDFPYVESRLPSASEY